MDKNTQAHDKAYKTVFHFKGIKAHNFFYNDNAKRIVFIETEISDTGQKGDVNYIIDDKIIYQNELQSYALNLNKLKDIYDYRLLYECNKRYKGLEVHSQVISIANPNHGIKQGWVRQNIFFAPDFTFIKEYDGMKIINTINDKCKNQEPLDDDNQMGLLILFDTDTDIPDSELKDFICKILVDANIPKEDYDDFVVCEIMMLERFFDDGEVSEVINMVNTKTVDSQTTQILDEYGPTFGKLYLHVLREGINKGWIEANERFVRNLFDEGCDIDFISKITGLSIYEIKKII